MKRFPAAHYFYDISAKICLTVHDCPALYRHLRNNYMAAFEGVSGSVLIKNILFLYFENSYVGCGARFQRRQILPPDQLGRAKGGCVQDLGESHAHVHKLAEYPWQAVEGLAVKAGGVDVGADNIGCKALFHSSAADLQIVIVAAVAGVKEDAPLSRLQDSSVYGAVGSKDVSLPFPW